MSEACTEILPASLESDPNSCLRIGVNLQKLQIHADSPAGIRIGFQAGWQNFRTGFRHGISDLVSRNSGNDWASMKTECISTGDGRLISKAYGDNFNYAPELHCAIMQITSFSFINCNADRENLVRNFNVNINTMNCCFSHGHSNAAESN